MEKRDGMLSNIGRQTIAEPNLEEPNKRFIALHDFVQEREKPFARSLRIKLDERYFREHQLASVRHQIAGFQVDDAVLAIEQKRVAVELVKSNGNFRLCKVEHGADSGVVLRFPRMLAQCLTAVLVRLACRF